MIRYPYTAPTPEGMRAPFHDVLDTAGLTGARVAAASAAVQVLRGLGADIARVPARTGKHHGPRTECGTLLCVGPKTTSSR